MLVPWAIACLACILLDGLVSLAQVTLTHAVGVWIVRCVFGLLSPCWDLPSSHLGFRGLGTTCTTLHFVLLVQSEVGTFN